MQCILILHSVGGAPPQSGITFLPQIPSSRSPAHPASHSLFFCLLPWAFCIKCRREGALHFNIGDCSSPLSNSVLPSLSLPWPRFSYHSIGPTPTYSPTILCPPALLFPSEAPSEHIGEMLAGRHNVEMGCLSMTPAKFLKVLPPHATHVVKTTNSVPLPLPLSTSFVHTCPPCPRSSSSLGEEEKSGGRKERGKSCDFPPRSLFLSMSPKSQSRDCFPLGRLPWWTYLLRGADTLIWDSCD